ncbi:AI-2E family transporter [Luteitalea sp. TBR-22]|uniref:AI-2E family transporter n=1 Tax=Luteitalea sp. TBR-22 TaxID=2802971 RepID=UPI001EF5504B|nr:AI-2E family transporter [Luteitalea sp. TBR-22]
MPIASDVLGQPLPFRENRFRRAFLLIFVLGITVVFLGMIRSFLLTILLAAIFAGLAYPLFQRLVGVLRGRRPLAAAATLLVGVIVVAAPLGLVAYMVTTEAIRLSASVRPWIERVSSQPSMLGPVLERMPYGEYFEPYREEILQKAGQWAASAGGFVVSSLSDTTLGTVSALFNFFILLYTVFFLLLDGPDLLQAMRRFLPLREGERDLLLDKFVSVTRATLKGTLVIGLVQGTTAGIAFWVAGVEHASFWGAIMVVLSVIPMLGGALVWVPTCLYLGLTGDWGRAVMLAAFCGLVVGSIDNVLRPRLVGRDTEMHDLMILFSTLGGIMMFGALGFIIGPIIAALFQTSWELFGLAFADNLPSVPAEASVAPVIATTEGEVQVLDPDDVHLSE